MNLETLRKTAAQMVAPGKGILAIDESFPTIKKRFDGIGVESNETSRQSYRGLLIDNPGGADYISGVILFDETIRQTSVNGVKFVDLLERQGVLPGIKVDTGAKDLAGHDGEKITEGLDGLRERLAEYRALGAEFAKWRAVIIIGDNGLPSRGCIEANTHALSRYAALCQEAGLVPMVEPEVLMEGNHSIAKCERATGETLKTLFEALYRQRVALEGIILKVNMVVPGKDCPDQVTDEVVADHTLRCLRNTVPAMVPGIVFLSGGLPSRMATLYLHTMNARYDKPPWRLSFSYGRALQEDCLKTWGGDPENIVTAQAALLHRERCNSLAALGQYAVAKDQVT